MIQFKLIISIFLYFSILGCYASGLIRSFDDVINDTFEPVPQNCPHNDSAVPTYYPAINCSKFWQCSNGVPYLFNCSANLEFDPVKHICKDPDSANCTGQGWSTTETPTSSTICTETTETSTSTQSTSTTTTSSTTRTSDGTTQTSTSTETTSTTSSSSTRTTTEIPCSSTFKSTSINQQTTSFKKPTTTIAKQTIVTTLSTTTEDAEPDSESRDFSDLRNSENFRDPGDSSDSKIL